MSMKNIYPKLMKMGKWTGCHQRADRSFFVGIYQFPIRARCTGVLLGQMVAIPLYFVLHPPGCVLVLDCGIMFLDWFLQSLKIRESTNGRRLFTGVLAGYALMTIYILITRFLFHSGVFR